MDIRLCFPNEYIAAADLRGRDVTLAVSRVTVEDLRTTDGGKKRKPIVYFREMEERNKRGDGENKRLVLNKTNATTIAKLYGPETNAWIGKRITLYPTTCLAFGDTVDCVRIRDVAPRQNGAPAITPPDPEPPPDMDEEAAE